MTTTNPFQRGDRVRRINPPHHMGTVIGFVQVNEDQFTMRRRNAFVSTHGKRWKEVQTAAKGDWKIGVHWDWEKEQYGDRVPQVTDPEFAAFRTKKWEWHQRHQRWVNSQFLEKITEQE